MRAINMYMRYEWMHKYAFSDFFTNGFVIAKMINKGRKKPQGVDL